MSVTHGTRFGEKALLPRTGSIWTTIHDRWAGVEPQRWKSLAMLLLHKEHHWTFAEIGRAFGHHRGHVLRVIRETQEELQRLINEQMPV